VSTMTAVVSTQSSIQCLLTSLYKTTMPVGLDGLPASAHVRALCYSNG
jgi:hypothetical protein